MAAPLLPDELWVRIEPLLPPLTPKPAGGRPPVGNREALTGILFILKTGLPWEYLPQEMNCGCGMTCWRRLRDWQAAGVWDQLHAILLAELNAAHQIDWSRAAIDSGSLRAVGGGEATGPNPTDRGKPGSKHHVLTDGHGIPLQVELSGAESPDIKHLFSLLTSVPPVRGKPGPPRTLPDSLYADRAYDSQDARVLLRWLGITPHLAKRNTPHGSGLGVHRWVVERTLSWLRQFRRLRVRYDGRADLHNGFLALAKSLICFRVLENGFC
jgi:transposase